MKEETKQSIFKRQANSNFFKNKNTGIVLMAGEPPDPSAYDKFREEVNTQSVASNKEENI